jgi:AGZA family xanthine/uracil permease-like MFS transporter
MISHAAEIDWKDAEAAIPAFLTIVTIPLSFSIANGLAFGFVAYTLLKVARGKGGQVGWLVYVLTVLFLVRFIYLSKE